MSASENKAEFTSTIGGICDSLFRREGGQGRRPTDEQHAAAFMEVLDSGSMQSVIKGIVTVPSLAASIKDHRNGYSLIDGHALERLWDSGYRLRERSDVEIALFWFHLSLVGYAIAIDEARKDLLYVRGQIDKFISEPQPKYEADGVERARVGLAEALQEARDAGATDRQIERANNFQWKHVLPSFAETRIWG